MVRTTPACGSRIRSGDPSRAGRIYILGTHALKRFVYGGIMEAMREAWTDERLDELNERVGDLSRRVDAGFDRLDAKVDGVGARLDTKIDGVGARLDAKIEALNSRIFGFGTALMVAIVADIVLGRL